MVDFTSTTRIIPHSDGTVFNFLSDMSNLEKIKNDVQIDKLKDFEMTKDEMSFSVAPIGKIRLRIVNREPNKVIEYKSAEAQIPFSLKIKLQPAADEKTEMNLVLEADISSIMKSMVATPVNNALDKVAEVIEFLPYQ